MTTSIRIESNIPSPLSAKSLSGVTTESDSSSGQNEGPGWGNFLPTKPESLGLTIIPKLTRKNMENEHIRSSSLSNTELQKPGVNEYRRELEARLASRKEEWKKYNSKEKVMFKLVLDDHIQNIFQYIARDVGDKPYLYAKITNEICRKLENRLKNILPLNVVNGYIDYMAIIFKKHHTLNFDKNYKEIQDEEGCKLFLAKFDTFSMRNKFLLEEMIIFRDELYIVMTESMRRNISYLDYGYRDDFADYIYDSLICVDRAVVDSKDELETKDSIIPINTYIKEDIEVLEKLNLDSRKEETAILKKIDSDCRNEGDVFGNWVKFVDNISGRLIIQQKLMREFKNNILKIAQEDIINVNEYKYICQHLGTMIQIISEDRYTNLTWSDFCKAMKSRGVRAPNDRIIRTIDVIYQRSYYSVINKIIDRFNENIITKEEVEYCKQGVREYIELHGDVDENKIARVGNYVLELLQIGIDDQKKSLLSWQDIESVLQFIIPFEIIHILEEIFSEGVPFDINPDDGQLFFYNPKEKRQLVDMIIRDDDGSDLSSEGYGKYDDSVDEKESLVGSVVLHEILHSTDLIEEFKLSGNEQYEARAERLDLLLSGKVDDQWRSALDELLQELRDQPIIPDPDSLRPNSVEQREAAQRLLARDIIFNLAFHHDEKVKLIVADRLMERICDPDDEIAGETVGLLMQAADFYLDEKIPEQQRNSPVNAMISVSVLQRLDELKRLPTNQELASRKRCGDTLEMLLRNEQQQNGRTGERSGLTALVDLSTDGLTGTNGKNELSRIKELTDRGRMMQPFELDMLAKQGNLLPEQEIVLGEVHILGQNEKLDRSIDKELWQIQDVFDPKTGQYATKLTIRDYVIFYYFGPIDEQDTLGKFVAMENDDSDNQPERIDLSSEFTDLTNPLAGPPKELRNMTVGLLLARFLNDPEQQINDFPQWLVKNGPEEARRLRLRGIHLSATAALRQQFTPIQG